VLLNCRRRGLPRKNANEGHGQGRRPGSHSDTKANIPLNPKSGFGVTTLALGGMATGIELRFLQGQVDASTHRQERGTPSSQQPSLRCPI